MHHYNHNLEASRSFFPEIVTTHTWEERAETCRLVTELGMELCSGGILGMGETWEQRLELAFELRELGPDEIPLNFLNPRPGTPLGGRPAARGRTTRCGPSRSSGWCSRTGSSATPAGASWCCATCRRSAWWAASTG